MSVLKNTPDDAVRAISFPDILLIAAVCAGLSACGGDTSSGAGARFLETEVVYRNSGTDIECGNVIVERGALTGGGNFAQCTWPCAVGGPRQLNREFYKRRWVRERSNAPYKFESDEVAAGICL